MTNTLAEPLFSDAEALRGQWFAVAETTDLAHGPLSRTLLGQALVSWRDPDGQIITALDRCPHREAPLSAGSTEDGVLTCLYHGWAFGAMGQCVTIPSASPDLPIPKPAHLPCLNTTDRYGLVWVCLGNPVADIPKILQDEDASFRRINNPVERWKTSATRMTDNFLDIAHFPWVHTGTFGSSQTTMVGKIDLEMLDSDFYGYRYEVDAQNPDASNVTTGVAEKVVHRTMTTGFQLPFTVRSTIHYDSGLDHIILLLSTPIDDTTSYFTFVVWRNDDFSVPSEEVIAFDRAIGAEDKWILEQLDGVLPLSQTGVVSTQSDKASVEWRRQFIKMIAG